MNESRHNVLLVDDDPDIVTAWEKALSRGGYEVRTAGSGEDALERLREQPCDAAVVDLALPGIPGMEVVAAAREADPTTVAIIVTGYASLDSAIQAVRQGAFDYLRKPVDSSELLDVLARGLEGRELFARNQRLLTELDQANRRMRLAQETLSERVAQLQHYMDALVELGKHLSGVHRPQVIMQQLLVTAAKLIGAQAGAIVQVDTSLQELAVIASCGIDRRELDSEGLGFGEGVLGEVAESGERRVVNDLLADPETVEDVLVRAGMRRVLAHPLSSAGHVLGVVAVFDELAQPFSVEDQDLVAMLAVQAGTILATSGVVRPPAVSPEPSEATADDFIDLENLLRD